MLTPAVKLIRVNKIYALIYFPSLKLDKMEVSAQSLLLSICGLMIVA